MFKRANRIPEVSLVLSKRRIACRFGRATQTRRATPASAWRTRCVIRRQHRALRIAPPATRVHQLWVQSQRCLVAVFSDCFSLNTYISLSTYINVHTHVFSIYLLYATSVSPCFTFFSLPPISALEPSMLRCSACLVCHHAAFGLNAQDSLFVFTVLIVTHGIRGTTLDDARYEQTLDRRCLIKMRGDWGEYLWRVPRFWDIFLRC